MAEMTSLPVGQAPTANSFNDNRPRFKGVYHWVTIAKAHEDDESWVPITLGEFPPLMIERGRRVCIPEEYLQVLKDANRKQLRCIMEAGKKPRLTETMITRFPISTEPASKDDYEKFMADQKILKMPKEIGQG